MVVQIVRVGKSVVDRKSERKREKEEEKKRGRHFELLKVHWVYCFVVLLTMDHCPTLV